MKNQGKANRNKGHRAERDAAKKFREIGYDFCKTSRQASRLLDDSKIDLAFIPYNVQVKAGYPKGLNYSTIMQEMEDALIQNFPPEDAIHSNPPVIIHLKGRKQYDKLVVITENYFYELLKRLKQYETGEKS